MNDVRKAKHLVEELKENVRQVSKELESLKGELQQSQISHSPADSSCVKIKRTALTTLQSEIHLLKQNLPTIVNYDLVKSFAGKQSLEKELDVNKKKVAEAREECLHWKARHDAMRSECEKERKEKISLKEELAETKQRVTMQSEYCAGMGAVCCTLLWKASQNEEAVPALLVGSQMQNFLSVVRHTLESFVATYQEAAVPSEMSEELQFVMGLCGTVTNIAASPEGRDYLCTNSICSQLIQTFITVLSAPSSKSLTKLKNLLVMALYNVSINQKGLGLLIKTSGMIPLLAWLLKAEESCEIRLHTLLLIHSLILENPGPMLLQRVRNFLPIQLLESLRNNASKDMKEVTEEVIQILHTLKKHEP